MIRTHGVPTQRPEQGDVIRFKREGVRSLRPTNYIEPWGVVEAVNRFSYRVRTMSGQQARVPKRQVFMVLKKKDAVRRLQNMEAA